MKTIPESIVNQIQCAWSGERITARVILECGCAILSLGDGEGSLSPSGRKLCEIELGSFSGAWRILKDGQVVLASQDALEEEEFNIRLTQLAFGKIIGMSMLSPLDICIEFEFGTSVVFPCCSSSDETFHCFLPEDRVAVFDAGKGWRVDSASIDASKVCRVEEK